MPIRFEWNEEMDQVDIFYPSLSDSEPAFWLTSEDTRAFVEWWTKETPGPIKALVDAANALINRLATVNTGHGEVAWRTARMQYGLEVSRLRDAIDAVEGQDGNDKKPTRLG